ncbi:MAG: VOC family protein [Chloroflexota bacterium]|nr:VOC family protein [Chloroflexota bacterium]
MSFEVLDFLYMSSRDVVADVAYFTDVLGGRLVFAIEDSGIKVAMVELTDGPPRVLLTDHLEGDRPILVYRVADLESALDELRGRGWTGERSLEIPHGPCQTFRSQGGQRIALYQLTRPGVAAHFEGRRDF